MINQSAVYLLMKSGKSHTILADNEDLELIFSKFINKTVSNVGKTSTNPDISIMGKEILGIQDSNDPTRQNYFLSGYIFATFLDRIESFTLLSNNAVVDNEKVIFKDKNFNISSSSSGKSIIKIESKTGKEIYLLASNIAIDSLFAGVSNDSPLMQFSSESPSVYLTAPVVDYRDMGNGPLTGIFYLTNSKFGIFMSEFSGIEVIRTNVEVDPNGYIN
ncbi:hypothetical protein [Lactobacillus intestinalis]|uniref:hypothetical protein n=1 Tax=Lactobacillus intestinalis TaxID=151781 RepID=UPI00266F7967|nr:hypothetical protein [Lactobacillus intestinalis]